MIIAMLHEAHNVPPISGFASAFNKRYLYSFSIIAAHMVAALGNGDKTIFFSLKRLLVSSIRGHASLHVQV